MKGVPYIISEEDTVSAYEEKGKKIRESNTAYDKGMRAFSSMDRINQVEVLTGAYHFRVSLPFEAEMKWYLGLSIYQENLRVQYSSLQTLIVSSYFQLVYLNSFNLKIVFNCAAFGAACKANNK